MTNTLIAEVAEKTFDYVIAGGGTAGLTLAARLSEDPSVTVAVIEAGSANLDDLNILIPAQFGKTFFNPRYDWAFCTTKQHNCNDAVSFWPRGKSLGGSSSMNYMNWSTPCPHDMNAFETLGNEGWNWQSFVKYSKKSETYAKSQGRPRIRRLLPIHDIFHEPTKEQLAVFPETFDLKNRGVDGPIQTSIPHRVQTIDKPFQDTMANMGIRVIPDPYGGDILGTVSTSSTIDPRTHTRSYAATGYYLPNKNRSNLTAITEAFVTRVLFSEAAPGGPKELLTATGVEFNWRQTSEDEAKSYIAHAHKEVILSAGTVKSPHILELSGVGSKEVLTQLSIDVKVDLPGVGENVQEHIFAAFLYELDDKVDHQTLDLLRDPTSAAEQMKLHASKQGIHCTGVTSYAFLSLPLVNPNEAPSFISKVAQHVEDKKSSGSLRPGLAEQLDLQVQGLKDETVPEMEILAFPDHGDMKSVNTDQCEPGKKYAGLGIILSHPLSRGTIHAVSKDPSQHWPEIDPHYFEEGHMQNFKFVRAFGTTEPWKSTVLRESEPGPSCSTDEEIREYIRKTVLPVWHAVGSCSMLPREKHGVVDSKLKVYGTKNLRVVDISIIPLQVSSHLQCEIDVPAFASQHLYSVLLTRRILYRRESGGYHSWACLVIDPTLPRVVIWMRL